MEGGAVVTLVTEDIVEFRVEYDTVKACETIANIVKDVGTDVAIPLPGVTSRIFECMLCYMRKTRPINEILDAIADPRDLCALACACNYLEHREMLELVTVYFGNLIRTLPNDQLASRFGVTRNFTEEDRRLMREEQEWCQEVDE
jgi:hypothetical protein